MENKHRKLSFVLIFLPTISLACPSSRCSQFYNKLPVLVLDKKLEEHLKHTEDNTSNTILAPVVKFTISGRHLSGVGEIKSPSAYPNIWINNNQYKNDICLVWDSQNPVWRNNLEVTYDEGSNTYLKIEVKSEGKDFWGFPEDFFIGKTIVYVKDMLCKGRVIESPLWHNDGGFHTGFIAVTVTDVLNGGENCN